MAERNADSGELAVDELRRKARRRLVGAIVLALAAVIVVPMLLEDEPRPLGDDVSVQIPSRDQGKFVNRLTGVAPNANPASTPSAVRDATVAPSDREARPAQPDGDAKPPPRPDSGDATASRSAPGAAPGAVATASTAVAPAATTGEAPVPSSAAPVVSHSSAGAAGAKKSISEAERRVLAAAPKAAAREALPQSANEPQRGADPKPATDGSEASAPSVAKAAPAQPVSGFVVQLAAFVDDKGANALANKLKRAGYAAYVEPVTTSRGTLWRVRVGGYASRPDADAARVKLKDEGYSGIVASAR